MEMKNALENQNKLFITWLYRLFYTPGNKVWKVVCMSLSIGQTTGPWLERWLVSHWFVCKYKLKIYDLS